MHSARLFYPSGVELKSSGGCQKLSSQRLQLHAAMGYRDSAPPRQRSSYLGPMMHGMSSVNRVNSVYSVCGNCTDTCPGWVSLRGG